MLTPSLQDRAVAVKITWKRNFHKMHHSLASMDIESRRAMERRASAQIPFRSATPGIVKKLPFGAPGGAATRSVPNRFRPNSSSNTGQLPVTKPPFPSSTQPRKPAKENVCYLCKQPGHWKSSCPNLPNIKTILAKIDANEPDSDEEREGPTEDATEEDDLKEEQGNEDA